MKIKCLLLLLSFFINILTIDPIYHVVSLRGISRTPDNKIAVEVKIQHVLGLGFYFKQFDLECFRCRDGTFQTSGQFKIFSNKYVAKYANMEESFEQLPKLYEDFIQQEQKEREQSIEQNTQETPPLPTQCSCIIS